MEQNLEQMIAHCEEICRIITSYHVSDLSEENNTICDSFRFGLIKFGIYLSEVDGVITQEERDCIKKSLGVCPEIEELRQLKYREHLSEKEYGSEIPLILKYCVLADAKKLIPNDPFRNQKSQIVYDTYRLFGQKMMSCQSEDSILSAKKFTDYCDNIKKFLEEFDVKIPLTEKLYTPLEVEETNIKETSPEKLEKILEDFNSLVGLKSVKDEVNSLVNLLKVQKMRKDNGMKISDISKHMVFSGNPGTGKTTVARTLAQVYKALGILKKGQLIEVDRGGLVKGYIGQTAMKTAEVIESALGGILFIDEAYTLIVGKGEGDFGQEAVDTLLKAMEDHRDDLVVIVAGYPELMEEFLASNPGLKSRFNKFIYFDDYTAEEQLDILKGMCQKQEYSLSKDAEEVALRFFADRAQENNINNANARDVRNYLEKAISNHASRVVNIDNASKEVLSILEQADLENIELE